MQPVDDSDVAFWSLCQTRVAGYLTTNGQLQLTLCGLYAGTASVLVTLGHQQVVDSKNYVVFYGVIPLLSLIVLTLAGNVYAWIHLQLAYLSLISNHLKDLKRLVTYEQWRHELTLNWEALRSRERVLRLLGNTVSTFITLPIRLNNIYRYYLLVYVGSGLACSIYSVLHGTPVLIPVGLLAAFLLFYTFSTIDIVKLETVGSYVRQTII